MYEVYDNTALSINNIEKEYSRYDIGLTTGLDLVFELNDEFKRID